MTSINLYIAHSELTSTAKILLEELSSDSQVNIQVGSIEEILANEKIALLLTDKDLLVISNSFKPLSLYEYYNSFILERRPRIYDELLVKAVGARSNTETSVLDINGGLGRDALVLAMASYNVTILENNPYLVIILKYMQITFTSQLNITQIIHINNIEYLSNTEQTYNVIYVDPMFEQNKKALAKKEMQLIDLFIDHYNYPVTHGHNQSNLWELLAKCATNKIIVKRDNKQANLFTAPHPDSIKLGKTIRFDIYLVKK